MSESYVFLSSPPKKTVRFGGKVTEVLSKYSQGNTQAFELLKHQLSDPEIKDVQIINWLHELRISVTHLTIEYEQLVSIVLKLPWLNRSKEVVEEYLSFLGSLVSAQTVYLRSCINMIVSHFLPSRVTIIEGDINISDSEDGDEDIVATFNTCHRALQIIAQYVPSAPRFLIPILVEKFPYVNKSPRVLECYIHNLLRITVYFPVLGLEILELVTEKLLKIDVNASRQDIEDAEQNACIANSGNCGAEEDIFNMDEDEDPQQRGRGVLSNTMVHPAAERLDLALSVFFAYIKEICFLSGSMDLNKTKDLYRDLLAVFDKLILPTHASCHVQFTMFYICSFKLEDLSQEEAVECGSQEEAGIISVSQEEEGIISVSQKEAGISVSQEEAGLSVSQEKPGTSRSMTESQVPPLRLPHKRARKATPSPVQDSAYRLIQEASASLRAFPSPEEAFACMAATKLLGMQEGQRNISEDLIYKVLRKGEGGELTHKTDVIEIDDPPPLPAATTPPPQPQRGRRRGRKTKE
ncbi:RNA polymerase I-specific transcription initiation factor RRN3 isoform X4 [Aquarana catesbeiana]|uniref:RNA polymerase I-specific transcription initiation factor RRN3 isoform X4 n=1 Tax=Aquarana catesbeiana TaxID=8400 RepID=UPI003CCA1325